MWAMMQKLRMIAGSVRPGAGGPDRAGADEVEVTKFRSRSSVGGRTWSRAGQDRTRYPAILPRRPTPVLLTDAGSGVSRCTPAMMAACRCPTATRAGSGHRSGASRRRYAPGWRPSWAARSLGSATVRAVSPRGRWRWSALPHDPRIVKPLAATDLVCEAQTGQQTYAITLFPALTGQTPRHPWARGDATRALDALGGLGQVLAGASTSPAARHLDTLAGTDGPVELFGHWSTILGDSHDPWASRPWVRRQARWLAESDATLREQCGGSVPAHTDLRADNIVMDRRHVFFVDWAAARLAAPWVDPAVVRLRLRDLGNRPGRRRHGRGVAVPAHASGDRRGGPDRLGATLTSLAAALHRMSRRPAQPGLPTVRPWQDRCAERLLAFAERRFEAKDLGARPTR